MSKIRVVLHYFGKKNTSQGYECNRPKKLKVKECQLESVEC